MIRVAEMSDLNRLCELYNELHEYHIGLRPEKFRSPEDDKFFRGKMIDFLNSDEWITLVHESGETIDGYVIFKAFNTEQSDEQPQRVCHITHFVVAEDSRRQGIGREIMDKVCEVASSVKCTCVRLVVNTLNADAIAFDEQMGFSAAEVLMEKKL